MPLSNGVSTARGIDRKNGRGLYPCGSVSDKAGTEVEKIHKEHKEQGVMEKIWKTINDDIDAAFLLTERKHSLAYDPSSVCLTLGD